MAFVAPVLNGGIYVGFDKPKNDEPNDCFKCIHGFVNRNSVTCKCKLPDKHTDIYDGEIYCNKFEPEEESGNG